MKYNEVNPFNGNNIEEDAPANATGPSVAGTGDDNTVHTKKKKKNLYDGRTKIARKFIERILKQRESRLKAIKKEEVNKEESLTEKVDKKLALKILSMMKNQKFKKISGDFVPQIYLSGMDKDKLKKEFGKLPRGLPSASSGVPVVDFINYAMGISKTVDGIDTEDGDKPQPKLYDYRSGKVIGKPKTVGDAAKMAGLKLENVELDEKINIPDASDEAEKLTAETSQHCENLINEAQSRAEEIVSQNEIVVTDEKKADWVTYRQALRDITKNVADDTSTLENFAWPSEPS